MTDHYCAVEGPSFPHVLSFIRMCSLVAGASSHPALLLTLWQSRKNAMYNKSSQLWPLRFDRKNSGSSSYFLVQTSSCRIQFWNVSLTVPTYSPYLQSIRGDIDGRHQRLYSHIIDYAATDASENDAWYRIVHRWHPEVFLEKSTYGYGQRGGWLPGA